jgi:hypothetical protein
MTAPTLSVRGSGNNTALALGCGVLFLLPFAGVGVFTAVQAVRSAAASNWAQAGFFSIFALTFGGVGIGGLIALAAGRRRLATRRCGRHSIPTRRGSGGPTGRRVPSPTQLG